MKRILLLILISFMLISFTNREMATVEFYDGSYSELKADALVDNLPFFISFYTDWCGPCKNMDKYTFTDPKLADYIDENYYAIKIDAESLSENGIEVAMRYNVVSYPTVIIFSPQGKILHRLNGYQSAKTLLAELEKYRFTSLTAESRIEEFSGPSGAPVIDLTKPITPTPAPTSSTSPTPSTPGPVSSPVATPPAPAVSGNGLFRINVSRQASQGYGIQLGVFGDYANVLKQVQALEANGHSNVLVNINELGGKTVFKLILGPYPTRTAAGTAKTDLKNRENRDGMLVDLSRYQ